MEAKVRAFVKEQTHVLMQAETCCKELQDAAQAWLDALGSAQEEEQSKKYLKELQEDIMPIETLIMFADSDAGANLFGTDAAKNIAAHAREIQAQGARYCDCPACAAAEAILKKEEEILK